MVFTEGTNSEPEYIDALKKLPNVTQNIALTIEVFPEHGVPLTLVKHAIKKLADDEIDECWCVFDVEWPKHHPNLLRAVNLARAKGVSLAISNPCFELWLVLHHQDFGKFQNTAEIESYSRKLDGRSGKSIDPTIYMPLRKAAARRAKKLDMQHETGGCILPHDNPSSGMYKLMQAIEG